MKTSYYGLVCRHCREKYPLGVESLRGAKYLFGIGPFLLECFRCRTTEEYIKFEYWLQEERYTEAQMGVARLRVHRARKLFGLF